MHVNHNVLINLRIKSRIYPYLYRRSSVSNTLGVCEHATRTGMSHENRWCWRRSGDTNGHDRNKDLVIPVYVTCYLFAWKHGYYYGFFTYISLCAYVCVCVCVCVCVRVCMYVCVHLSTVDAHVRPRLPPHGPACRCDSPVSGDCREQHP